MNTVAILLQEDRGIYHLDELIQVGVPLERGCLFQALNVSLTDADQPLVLQTSPTAFWPDGSIRWLTVSFIANLEPHESRTLALHLDGSQKRPQSPAVLLNDAKDHLSIEFESRCIELPHGRLEWVSKEAGLAEDVRYQVDLRDISLAAPSIGQAKPWRVLETGPVYTRLESEGEWVDDQGKRFARYTCILTYFNGGTNLAVEFCIHNPNRARHPGGLWDLGDPGSIHFRSLELIATFSGVQGPWLKEQPEKSPLSQPHDNSLRLYQDSSGGENWQSRNHIDAHGNVTTRFRGYRVYAGQNQIQEGLRAEPIVGLESKSLSAQASLRKFWQNFPSALVANTRELRVGLFPAESATPYELQGGERKTHTAYFHLGADTRALDWTQHPTVPVISADHYEQADAFPWFKAGVEPGPLEALIQQGIEGPNNFFRKREIIDEYGWRNFGDIFADHETLYQKPDDAPYISHYNNQYDAIYGFARQFALSGDRRWFELMDDLARHVCDIDIYHTQEDRAEYNNGLFWHTDHYLDAHTATHRTFTRFNTTSSTAGQTGGGPAEEHCYSTGLMFHALMTESSASKKATLGLAEWITNIHEGTGGFFEQLLAIKKYDIPQVRNMISGYRPTRHRYLFTRGTGNYINTLLDAWFISGDEKWLRLSEKVIHNTIHPEDDINRRQLLSVETGWSYLILLSSIAKFLYIKNENSERDQHFNYALASFCHYTRWMAENESITLSNPERLEFPNETWTAQDFRKIILMHQAAIVDPAYATQYLKKAKKWRILVQSRLSTSNEARFSRILIILMQNYGPQELLQTNQENLTDSTAQLQLKSPALTWPEIIMRIIRRLARGIVNFRPNRERLWLGVRLNRP